MEQDMNELLLQSIESLPPLPQTIIDLQKYLDSNGEDIDINKVAKIIVNDPLVTAKLLQLANSPFYGFSREISTIQQVINLLGVANIRNIIAADAVRNNLKVDMSPYNLETSTFLANCHEETRFIIDWISQEDKKLSHLLVPCAMLLRFGMMVFANFLIQSHKDKDFLASLKENNFENLSAIEENFLGVDHLSFLGFLFYRWNFDDLVTESVVFATSPHSAENHIKKNAYALAIANTIFDPYNDGSNVNIALNLIEEASEQGIKFNVDNFKAKLPDFAKNKILNA